MGGYARCYNCGYTVAKDEDTLCDVCQSPSDNNYTEPLIAERDRLAAANAMLDALRAAVPEIFTNDNSHIWRNGLTNVQRILYPQPKDDILRWPSGAPFTADDAHHGLTGE